MLYKIDDIFLGKAYTINKNAYYGEEELVLSFLLLQRTGVDENGIEQFKLMEKPDEYYSLVEKVPITSFVTTSKYKFLMSFKNIKQLATEISSNLGVSMVKVQENKEVIKIKKKSLAA